MQDFQEPQSAQPVEAFSPRRGIAFAEKTDDVESFPHTDGVKVFPHIGWRTKDISVGSITDMHLSASRDFGETNRSSYVNASGYTIDAEGNITEGKAMDFHNKGYYEIYIAASGPEGSSRLPSVMLNLWVGNGEVVSGELTQQQGANREEGADYADYGTFLEREVGNLYLPLDIELIKKLRFSIQSMPLGGDQR